jgi:hypothetical protein
VKKIVSPKPLIPLLPIGPEADLLRRAALWPAKTIPFAADEIDALDRPVLLELAQEHRLLPALFGAIEASGLGPHWPELHAAQQRESMRALHQAATTLRLLDLFEQAGCRALVLKGQALSAQLYGRADVRMSSDIDFLIDPMMMSKAHDIIIESGFKPLYPVPVGNLSFVNKDQAYFSGKTMIELHWRLFDNQAFLPWSFDYLWSNRSFVSLMQSKKVPTLPRGQHIFYHTLHGLRHGWQRLRWLVDLAIPFQNKNDMEDLILLAKDYNFFPALLHTSMILHEFFNISPGTEIKTSKKQYKSAKRIHTQVEILARIRNEKKYNKFTMWIGKRVSETRIDIMLSPNNESIIFEIKKLLISRADLMDVKLPKKMLWLHIFIRPFLLMRRVFFRYWNRNSD